MDTKEGSIERTENKKMVCQSVERGETRRRKKREESGTN